MLYFLVSLHFDEKKIKFDEPQLSFLQYLGLYQHKSDIREDLGTACMHGHSQIPNNITLAQFYIVCPTSYRFTRQAADTSTRLPFYRYLQAPWSLEVIDKIPHSEGISTQKLNIPSFTYISTTQL